MTTLLASLIGFISSIIPEIIKYLKDLADKKHERALLSEHIKCSDKEKLRDVEDMRIVRDILDLTLIVARVEALKILGFKFFCTQLYYFSICDLGILIPKICKISKL